LPNRRRDEVAPLTTIGYIVWVLQQRRTARASELAVFNKFLGDEYDSLAEFFTTHVPNLLVAAADDDQVLGREILNWLQGKGAIQQRTA
jgi:hypothetical protein